MDRSIFLDTSFILAYVFKDDKYNSKAIKLQNEISKENIIILTTDLILVEVANSLSKVKFRHEAVITINNLQRAANVLPIDRNTFEDAWNLFEKRTDKEWGLTDCYSFVVMEKFGIKQALTTDKHFEQAGFEILLK